MASSYFTESEAPKDFRVSSTESDGHYTKCLLCYTVKRNFYCAECIRTGNFVHTSMPYSDKYSEKQGKLLRLKVNRKYILDRCEKLLRPKLKKDTLVTEAKQSRDRLDLLRLAIEQRRQKIEEKKKELSDLTTHNGELRLRLPRYQKRVSTLEKHAQHQGFELQNKINIYNDQVESLAALRRSRIRQLTKYIFPVYMTYDMSDSIEDMEFIGSDTEEEPQKRTQLHIVVPWITTDGDFSQLYTWMKQSAESGGSAGAAGGAGAAAGAAGGAVSPSAVGAYRAHAALALVVQLLALLAWSLDQRLPHALSLQDYWAWRCAEGGAGWRVRRACACAAALCACAPLPLQAPLHPLAALHGLLLAASADDPALGRPAGGGAGGGAGGAAEWAARWAAEEAEPEPEPEHLHWPEPDHGEELVGGAGAGAPGAGGPTAGGAGASLVTSAAASLASMWRVWTK